MRLVRLWLLCVFIDVPVFSSTYTVNDLGDAPDATAGDDICATAGAVCTLRAAIQEANAHAGADTIVFSVAGTISPATTYPSITQQTTIDGTTAPGYASPVVVIEGATVVSIGIDLAVGSNQSVINGLQLGAIYALV